MGNFLPDLDLLSCPSQLHQKKKHGRNESSRRRSRESSEFMHKDKMYEELSGGEEKHRFHQKNVDRPSSSKSQDVKSVYQILIGTKPWLSLALLLFFHVIQPLY